jgi:hypothetical protein
MVSASTEHCDDWRKDYEWYFIPEEYFDWKEK